MLILQKDTPIVFIYTDLSIFKTVKEKPIDKNILNFNCLLTKLLSSY